MRCPSGARRAIALWACIVAVVVTSWPSPAAATPRQEEAEEPGRVLLVTFPRLTWERVRDVQPPVLTEFLEGAAVASASPRTIGAKTSPLEAYLTIGAGNRAAAVDREGAALAAAAEERTPVGRAGAVHERRIGHPAQPGSILNLGFAAHLERNERLLYGTEPGSLAQTLAEDGIVTAAVGNAGHGLDDPYHREVALAAADQQGQVALGDVGEDLLVEDETVPFGVRADPDAYAAALAEAWSRADVAIVEMSDLERAEAARGEARSEQAERQFDEALLRSDELFGRLLETVDRDRDVVMVLGPTAPVATEQLTVFGIAGPEVSPGWARSSTTRRSGYVTLTDVAPTVLRHFGIEVPSALYDTPVSDDPSEEPLGGRLDHMVTQNARAIFRDQATGPITVAFIVLLVALALAVAWALARGWSALRALRCFALVVLAVPSVVYLTGLLPYGGLTTVSYGVIVLGISVVVAVCATPLGRIDPVLPAVAVASLCLVVLLVDVATGARLQLNTMFGYSPIVAGRFAGYGNQAFSLVAICTLLVATAGWEMWERRWPGSSERSRSLGVAALFVVVVAFVGAPMFGSDVGGVLASVPAFAVCLLLLRGRRLDLRTGALIAASAVALLGAFALVDMARPPESRTHLGRFVEKVVDGDALLILQRKLDTNLNILTSTVWTITIPVALLFFGYLTWRPNGLIGSLEEEHSTYRAFGISACTLGAVAFALNDSGVALPAMMLAVVLPYTAYLVLGVHGRARPRVELDDAAAVPV